MEFVDIHCHLLPDLDDGAESWEEAIEMARMAASDGIVRAIMTPHQLGGYRGNVADLIRQRAAEFRRRLAEAQVPLQIRVGGDVRVDPDILERIDDGTVLSLADHSRHVLLELPHELYFPLETLIAQLKSRGYQAILSHPERNQGILNEPQVISDLVNVGCLMQVTAGSLLGGFGEGARMLAEQMVRHRQVHLVATDAHGTKSRRPRMDRAYRRLVELSDAATAEQWCSLNPARVFHGQLIALPRAPREIRRRGWLGLARSN